MRKILQIIFLLVVLLSVSVKAQNNKQLLQQLQKQKNNSEKITTLHKLSINYITKPGDAKADIDSAFYYTNQAQKISSQLKYKRGESYSNVLYAKIYNKKHQNDKALTFAQKALDMAIANYDYDIQGDAYIELYDLTNWYTELDKKTAYIEKALEAYKKKATKVQLAFILITSAEHYDYLGNNPKAIDLANQSLKIYRSIGHKDMVNVYRALGNVYSSTGQYKKAVEYLLLAAKYGEEKNNLHDQLSFIYNQLAAVYHHLHEDKLSYNYLSKSLEHALAIKNIELIYTVTNNMVVSLINEKKYAKAERFLNGIYSKYKPINLIDVVTVKTCYLDLYTKLSKFDRAQVYSNQLTDIIKNKEGDIMPHIIFNANMAIARMYLAKGNYDTAKQYLAKNLKNIDQSVGFANKKSTYTVAYQIDSAQGNYKEAIEYLKKVKTQDDSLFNIDKNKEISQLQIAYETEQKDRDILLKNQNIKLLAKEGELQKQKTYEANKSKNIFLGGTILLLITVGAIYLAYRNKIKVNRLLRSQQVEISLKNNTLNHLLEEKEWLLKEIHHRVKNNLQIVMSLLNSQSVYLKDATAVTAIKDSQRRVHSMSLIHQKLYQSDNLSAIAMPTYIHELVAYLKDSFDTGYIQFKVTVCDVLLDVSQAVPIGLILNEAITNAIKYAFTNGQDGTIAITLQEKEPNYFEMLITDNGKGIDSDFDAENSNSLGMSLMQGLTGDLNGTFSITNNNGTVIKINFKRDLRRKPVL